MNFFTSLVCLIFENLGMTGGWVLGLSGIIYALLRTKEIIEKNATIEQKNATIEQLNSELTSYKDTNSKLRDQLSPEYQLSSIQLRKEYKEEIEEYKEKIEELRYSLISEDNMEDNMEDNTEKELIIEWINMMLNAYVIYEKYLKIIPSFKIDTFGSLIRALDWCGYKNIRQFIDLKKKYNKIIKKQDGDYSIIT